MRLTTLFRPACWLLLAGLAILLPVQLFAAVGWRTDGTGKYPDANPPLEWGPDKNIIWKTPLPSWGNASPILVKDRLFFCAEPTTLVCVNAADGTILWQHSNQYEEIATPEEVQKMPEDRQAVVTLQKELQPLYEEMNKVNAGLKQTPDDEALKTKKTELQQKIAPLRQRLGTYQQLWYLLPSTEGSNGFSSPTPVSDGTFVYVLFGTGVAACYDLDGNRKWIKFLEKPTNGWGHSASPLLAGNKLLVHILNFMALNPATGEVLWKTRVPELWGTAAVTTIGDTPVAITPSGFFLRLEDGKPLAQKQAHLEYCGPVIDNGIVYFIENNGKALKLPDTATDPLTLQVLWTTTPKKERYYSSPIIHDGLIYAINQQSIFSIIDAATGQVVTETKLPFSGATIYQSFCLAGKYIFMSGENGTTVVLEPGREGKVLFTNKLEPFRTTPIFAGNRMYVRTRKNLYCIGMP